MGTVCSEIYFRLINDCDEGTDSVPGDGETKKRGLFGGGPEWRERERAEFHVEE